MRTLMLPLAAIALLGAGAATARDKAPPLSDEAKFAQAVAGLTPDKPIDCLPTARTASSLNLTAIGTKLLYKQSRTLIYVNDTGGGCENVARGDALITTSPTGRLCRGDIARTVDFPARIPSGSCGLGSFTPYRAAK